MTTDRGFSVGQFYKRIGDAIRDYHITQFRPPVGLRLNEDDWQSLCDAVRSDEDGAARTLFLPDGVEAPAVGLMQGLPVTLDPNLEPGQLTLVVK